MANTAVARNVLDSVPVFLERAAQMGAEKEWLDAMVAKNLASFGKFAFSSRFNPNQTDEMPFVKVVASIIGSGSTDPTDDQMAIFRRLFFESYAMATAELRARVERKGDEAPRPLMLPERSLRNKDQCKRLKGIRFER